MKLPPLNSLTKGAEVPDSKEMLVSLSEKHTHEGENFRVIVKSSKIPLLTTPQLDVFSTIQIMIVFPNEEEQEIYLNIAPNIIAEEQAKQALKEITNNFKLYLPND